METFDKHVLSLFADILDYPYPQLGQVIQQCESLVKQITPDAAELLCNFLAFVEETSTEQIEELYTGLFDLNPVCYPYIGYHIFGESYKRSIFLLALKERYRAKGFKVSDSDLPDRLPVMLRFISISEDKNLNSDLIKEGLLPALEKITKSSENAAKPVFKRDYQPEGFCHGEIFQGGFLLEAMKEAAGDDGGPRKVNNPYHQVLLALRIMLRAFPHE